MEPFIFLNDRLFLYGTVHDLFLTVRQILFVFLSRKEQFCKQSGRK